MLATDLNVGMELEVTGGAADLISRMFDADLLGSMNLHDYHCDCEVCAPCFTRGNPWTAQEDCTVDGEFITKPFRFGSAEFDAALVGMGTAIVEARATVKGNGRWSSAGNHVHVESQHMNPDWWSGPIPAVRLERLLCRYRDHLEMVAYAAHGGMRPYGNTPNSWGARPWQNDTRQSGWADEFVRVRPSCATTEFRMWNATRAAWRMRLHAGLSAAMMAHACTMDAVPVVEDDARTLIEVIAPHADDETVESYYRQARFVGAIAA